ncbi:hypothetical protein DFJ73DRAFT_760359 [Zopfochytrium polystomum]|nr:hypothetical protein DFJ73DRAFT_760359 [Zopfochytrium polystomum]
MMQQLNFTFATNELLPCSKCGLVAADANFRKAVRVIASCHFSAHQASGEIDGGAKDCAIHSKIVSNETGIHGSQRNPNIHNPHVHAGVLQQRAANTLSKVNASLYRVQRLGAVVSEAAEAPHRQRGERLVVKVHLAEASPVLAGACDHCFSGELSRNDRIRSVRPVGAAVIARQRPERYSRKPEENDGHSAKIAVKVIRDRGFDKAKRATVVQDTFGWCLFAPNAIAKCHSRLHDSLCHLIGFGDGSIAKTLEKRINVGLKGKFSQVNVVNTAVADANVDPNIILQAAEKGLKKKALSTCTVRRSVGPATKFNSQFHQSGHAGSSDQSILGDWVEEVRVWFNSRVICCYPCTGNVDNRDNAAVHDFMKRELDRPSRLAAGRTPMLWKKLQHWAFSFLHCIPFRVLHRLGTPASIRPGQQDFPNSSTRLSPSPFPLAC